MYYILNPAVRFSIGAYIKPFNLDHVLHMVKPTLRVSPFGWVHVHMTLLPHRHLYRSQGIITITLNRDFAFGSLQFTVFNRSFNRENALHPIASSDTERMRRYVNLPVSATQKLDIVCSDNTVFISANVFEKKRLAETKTVFQGVPPRPPDLRGREAVYPILFLVPLALALIYYLNVLSEVYRSLEKGYILRISGVVLGLLAFIYIVVRY